MDKGWFLFNGQLEFRCGLSKSMDSWGPIENTSESENPARNDMDKNIHNRDAGDNSSYSIVDNLVGVGDIWNFISDDIFLLRDRDGDRYFMYFDIENKILEIDNDHPLLSELESLSSFYRNSSYLSNVSNSDDPHYDHSTDDTEYSWNNYINSYIDSYLRSEIYIGSSGFSEYSYSSFCRLDLLMLEKLVDWRRKSEGPPDADRIQYFSGFWAQCDECEERSYKINCKQRKYICEYCGSHMKMPSSERIDLSIDPGTWNPMDKDLFSLDPIKWDSQLNSLLNRQLESQIAQFRSKLDFQITRFYCKLKPELRFQIAQLYKRLDDLELYSELRFLRFESESEFHFQLNYKFVQLYSQLYSKMDQLSSQLHSQFNSQSDSESDPQSDTKSDTKSDPQSDTKSDSYEVDWGLQLDLISELDSQLNPQSDLESDSQSNSYKGDWELEWDWDSEWDFDSEEYVSTLYYAIDRVNSKIDQLLSQLSSQLNSQSDPELDFQSDSESDPQLDSEFYSLHYSPLRSESGYQLDLEFIYKFDSEIDYLHSQLRSQIDQLDSLFRCQMDQLNFPLRYKIDQLQFQLNYLLDPKIAQLNSELDSQFDSEIAYLHSQFCSKIDQSPMRSRIYDPTIPYWRTKFRTKDQVNFPLRSKMDQLLCKLHSKMDQLQLKLNSEWESKLDYQIAQFRSQLGCEIDQFYSKFNSQLNSQSDPKSNSQLNSQSDSKSNFQLDPQSDPKLDSQSDSQSDSEMPEWKKAQLKYEIESEIAQLYSEMDQVVSQHRSQVASELAQLELESEDDEPYVDKVYSNQRETGLKEAIQTGTGRLNGIPVAIGVMEFEFIGGSMGSVVGEKITRLIEYATKQRLPLILVCASGGARMQEGSLSLMQMAKISSVLYDYQLNKKLFLISILTSPTTGGVVASFGMLGDIIIAEPDAYIAFTGKRVIEELLKVEIPEGTQETEYLFDKGLFDPVVPRNLLKDVLSELLQLHNFFPLAKNKILKSNLRSN